MDGDQFSFANLSNLPLLENLYQSFLKDPSSVESSWRYFFEGMAFAASTIPQAPVLKTQSPDLRIFHLLEAYRRHGHLMASFNPIATTLPREPGELNLEKLSFEPQELQASFSTCGFLKEKQAPLQTIIDALKRTYCSKIGIEYLGSTPELEKWIQEQIEPNFPLDLSREEKLQILHELNKAELFESFLHTKYVGQKRFSLEGGETLIPLLSALIERGSAIGIREVVIGMSHRGRLNVLANILNKSYAHIFHEFEDDYAPGLGEGSGDVKYHKGFVGEWKTRSGVVIPVSVVANPSHLESVDPVAEGIARAKQELNRDRKLSSTVVPILIHGDAALAGQGVIYETMQMSSLNGYSTAGTVHIVVNNQIGFTTPPKDAQSTSYCTEIAKTFHAPVFHVNAEDPEGCIRVAKLAIEIRNRFQCDVFIDLNCYRKYGHNEGDEPFFSQPLEYTLIKSKRSIREIFREQLIQEGVLDEAGAKQLEDEFKNSLQVALENIPKPLQQPLQEGAPIHDLFLSSLSTGVAKENLLQLAERLCAVPEGLQIHPKIQRLLRDRFQMLQGDPLQPTIDWGMGEQLAFATLLHEGIHVRLSGQDVRRGTFSHRHAVWIDQVNGKKYFPLSHLSSTQAPFDVYNSLLSEYAVLGFDFGYSTAYPHSLVIWEAQFGDFANGAQITIDQYIASSEQKWSLLSNLTLLLPHGYEGQGPEHSSARIERFLQLTGHENIRVVNATTPAQLFHALRAQAKSTVKKPLVLFSPKALLRHPGCISPLQDFINGSFREILDDPAPPAKPQKILLCSGKIFYDLLQERQKRNLSHIAIIRIEQLYPFPRENLLKVLEKYKECQVVCWAQEEPLNMGAGDYLHGHTDELFGSAIKVQFAGRERSASPATGSHLLHKQQHEALMNQIFEG